VTEIIAHRGDSAHAPENTLRAFHQAIDAGCDRIELDVQISADGVPFVFHDFQLERLTGARGVARERSCSDLEALQVLAGDFGIHADSCIPRLTTVLEQIGTRCPLYVEIKVDRVDATTRQLVGRCVEQVAPPHVLASFDLEVVRLCVETDRPTVWITADPSSLQRIDPGLQTRLHAVSALHTKIDRGFVSYCEEIGLPLWCWTLDAPADFDRLRRLGADTAWCTNDPRALSDWLNHREDGVS